MGKKKWIVYSFLFVISSFITFMILWNQVKDVVIQVDDQIIKVKTTAKTVNEVLIKENITIREHDLLWPEKETKIQRDQHILVKKAWPIQVKLGLEPTKTIWTTARTVGDVLRQIGYSDIEQNDIIQPEVDTPLKQDQKIEVVYVSHGTLVESREVKYRTVRKADQSLIKGTERIITRGEPGELQITYKTTIHNGQVVDKEELRSEPIDEPVEEVVAYGTLESVSVGGYTFYPKKVLKNVRLTAYGPGPEHTGKGPDDPGYAMTRSGLRATEGRTVSVDPDLIPLGWWVYIEGFGLYRAEDTGGAVKGKIIDIYYEDDDKATKFGTQRGYTVYVIGPQKPSQS